MSAQGKRLNALEGATTARRLVVATVPPGATLQSVTEAAGFDLQPSDMVVIINKPEGCPGSVRVCGA